MTPTAQTYPTKSKVLIVDDDPQNIHILLEILKNDYAIVAAKNGTKALELAGKIPQPDLIVLDVMMPDMDGYAVCQAIKSQSETRDIPIIFISALDAALDKVKAFDVGGVDYITKPFQREEVLVRIATHIEIYHLRQQLYQQTAQVTEKNKKLIQINEDLQTQYRQMKATQLQLIQAEKMASLGELMAGVAHEINNPTGFIKANIEPAMTYVQELFDLIDFLLQECPSNATHIQDELEAADLEFIREDLPKILSSMNLGVARIGDVSDSLRIFARRDQDNKVAFKLEDGLNSTLLILKHRTKANADRPAIEIVKYYDNIPEVYCFPGQINQVFMNILANAIDAIEEANQGKTFAEIKAAPNQIVIETKMLGNDRVQVRIQDNGCGMKPETQARIFEDGFTTKEVSKGTGLGMAIARQIIEEKHGGMITCNSTVGEGTIFTIIIPKSN
ncbi:MAG: response regulator [Okeania sp. SIO3I5]|uniref:hybrid sensor histidine kinase/response regulator n=1 Tax=Okeania sp. SIO3I5 TaxID=2607805 RepID=UPI0013B9421D|nr:response regulator [Okeania sp. SIO3I5]NEQ37503.1 response regulator [Okeania sp. SIO3I5]